MISVPGSHNVMSRAEFKRRLGEGTKLAGKLFPGEKKWLTRLQSVSITTSGSLWSMFQTWPKEQVMKVVEEMIRLGAPLDDPLKNVISFGKGEI